MAKKQQFDDLARISRPTPGVITFTIMALLFLVYIVSFPLLRATISASLLLCVLAESYYWGIWQSRYEPLIADPPRNTVLALPLLPIIGSIALCTYNTYQPITWARAVIITALAINTALLSYLYGRWRGTRLTSAELLSHNSSLAEYGSTINNGE